jgi:hypothetical protein
LARLDLDQMDACLRDQLLVVLLCLSHLTMVLHPLMYLKVVYLLLHDHNLRVLDLGRLLGLSRHLFRPDQTPRFRDPLVHLFHAQHLAARLSHDPLALMSIILELLAFNLAVRRHP